MDSFSEIISNYQKKIDKRLREIFDEEINNYELSSLKIKKDLRTLKEYTLRGGKRIRPILINCGYFLSGGRNENAILDASVCVELIHNFFLIHDDIVDRDYLRRGDLSLHYFYKNKYESSLLGMSLAMIWGDMLNAFGYFPILESKFKSEYKIEAVSILADIIKKTCYGEIMEMLLKENLHRLLKQGCLTEDRNFKKLKGIERDILNVYKYKTAFYTFIGPLKIGAVLAGADSEILKNIEKAGLNLGLAFQIKDDILGLFGAQKEIGKPVGSDIRELQPNILIVQTLNLSEKSRRKKFVRYLGKNLKKSDISELKNITAESGALSYCEKKMHKFIRLAKENIINIQGRKKEKRFLLQLADYIIKRNY